MKKPNKDIRDKVDLFIQLLFEEKLILSNPIKLDRKENNANWLIGKSSVNHISIPEDINFIVEKSCRDAKYGIKLQCIYLTNEPFFRFDSDGPAHRNDYPDIPLEEQLITTPHFNSFENDGSAIAFKNKALQDEGKSKAIQEDVNFGISLFCMETASALKDGNFPEVLERVPVFEFEVFTKVDFDDIKFD